MAPRLPRRYIPLMTYWVKQHRSGIATQVGAATAREAVERGEAWEPDGPVTIETPDGDLFPLDQFRKNILGAVKWFGDDAYP